MASSTRTARGRGGYLIVRYQHCRTGPGTRTGPGGLYNTAPTQLHSTSLIECIHTPYPFPDSGGALFLDKHLHVPGLRPPRGGDATPQSKYLFCIESSIALTMDTESELEVARVITEDADNADNVPGDNSNLAEPLPASPTSSTASLKRPAGDMDDERGIQPETSNKRRKRESVGGADETGDGTDAARLVREMEVELGCPCCSALCYNPVIALPCQHYFCGRSVVC